MYMLSNTWDAQRHFVASWLRNFVASQLRGFASADLLRFLEEYAYHYGKKNALK
jgi:hypothetical protein